MPVDNKLFIFTKDGKCGFKNANDEIVIECKFNEAFDFKNGFARVEKDRK